MKSNNSQPRDYDRLIKLLNQLGRIHSKVRPGFAERIKQQIPENLEVRRRGPVSMRAIMNLRVGKLIAAVVITGEVILLLNLLCGADLSRALYMQGKHQIKCCKPTGKEKWNNLVNQVGQYICLIEPQRQISKLRTIAKEPIAPKQQELRSIRGVTRHKEIDNIDAEVLVAVVKREAGPGRPLEKSQSVNWSNIMKASRTQESIEESTQRNTQVAVDALRSFGRLVGTYPKNLSMMSIMREFRMVYRTKRAVKAIPKEQRHRQLVYTTAKLRWLCDFYKELLKKAKDPAYHGDKIEPGMANAVLMRWRLATGEYQVIFANLQVATIPAEQLWLLEATLPQ